jgi:hypothetical protein
MESIADAHLEPPHAQVVCRVLGVLEAAVGAIALPRRTAAPAVQDLETVMMVVTRAVELNHDRWVGLDRGRGGQ